MFSPDVLANRHPDPFAVNEKGFDALSRLKIPLFVKNIVRWQQGLVSFPDWFTTFEQSRGVTKWFSASVIAVHESHEQRRIPHARVQLCQQLQILRDETRFENQILRRVSGHCQLRREHEFRARSSEPLIR